MFAERRYCEKMSKNSGFLDISQEHVQDMDMLFEACGISLWRDIEFAPDKAVFGGAIPIIARHWTEFSLSSGSRLR